MKKQPKKAVEAAKKNAVKHFGAVCIVTGATDCEPADIFPPEKYPWLESTRYNYVPLKSILRRECAAKPAEYRVLWLRSKIPASKLPELDGWLSGLLVSIAGAGT